MGKNKFLAEYKNKNVEKFNLGLINREQDKDLLLHLNDVFKSLDVLEYVEFLGSEYVDDVRKIDMTVYTEFNNREKKSKKKDEQPERFMSLHDTRVGELRAKFKFTCKGEEEIVEKRFLVPIVDEYGQYTIGGKRFFLIYQLVDSSTYMLGNTVVLKSLTPVNLNRERVVQVDFDGVAHEVNKFSVMVMHSKIDIMYLYFAKYGVTNTLRYFSVSDLVKFTEEVGDKETNIYFTIRGDLYLEVNRVFFEKHEYLRSIVGSVMTTMNNRTHLGDLDSAYYWTDRIGALSPGAKAHNSMDKGKNTRTYFERMIDKGTSEILKLSEVNNGDSYSTIRWMVQNYEDLRKKDDMDLKNKRLRCNEYIAGFITAEFTKRVNRIIRYKNRVDLKKVKGIVSMPGDIIINRLHYSGLFRSNEAVNDMDFFSKLKYTSKGPSAMGNKSSNSIAVKYRGIDPSYIGNIDTNVCGSSDPGSSGVLTPFAEVENLYFDNTPEVQSGIFEYEKELNVLNNRIDENKEILFDMLGGDISHEEYLRRQEALLDISKKVTFS